MLEDDAEGDAGVARRVSTSSAAAAALRSSGFSARTCFPARAAASTIAAAGVGRGEEEDRLHAGVGEHRLERGGGGQAVAGGEGGAAGGVAGEDAADLDLPASSASARACTSATMPEAHDPDPQRLHGTLPVARSRCGSGGRRGRAAA